MNLTPLEQTAWLGLQARYALLNQEQAAVIAEIARRLKLSPNAIGTTHGIDAQAGIVVERQTTGDLP